MHPLPHPLLPAEVSDRLGLRARGIQAYLGELIRDRPGYPPIQPIPLVVSNERDWSEYTRLPYGWPRHLTRPSQLLIPGIYPERWLWRLRQGFHEGRTPLPVQHNLTAWLDLSVGQALGRPVLEQWGLLTRQPWADELLASLWWLGALEEESRRTARQWLEQLILLPTPRSSRPAWFPLWVQGQTGVLARSLLESDPAFWGDLLAASPLSKGAIRTWLLQRHPRLADWRSRLETVQKPVDLGLLDDVL